MKYFIFESEAHKGLHAITSDFEGAQLDPKAGRWILKREIDADKTRGLIGFPTDLEALNADLEKSGVRYMQDGFNPHVVPSRPA